eukprot:gene32740-33808_t
MKEALDHMVGWGDLEEETMGVLAIQKGHARQLVSVAYTDALEEVLAIKRGLARQLVSVAYTDAMKEVLIKDTKDLMAGWGDTEGMKEVLALNNSENHWKCAATPWKLKGGKLGLVVVQTHASYQHPREVLRKSYAQFDSQFDRAYTAAFPAENVTIQSAVCAEAERAGDMLLVNCKERHEGQIFHLLKLLAQLLESVWKGGYKYVIKVDGGTFIHLPHLEQWITAGKKSAELSTPYVLFGPRIQHYYKSPFIGMSSDVLTHVMSRVEAKWIGVHHELWLVGLWMRLYGPLSIIDVAVAPEQHVLVHQGGDIAKAIQIVQAHAEELLFFHVRGLGHMTALIDALSTALASSATQPTVTNQEVAQPHIESAPSINCTNTSTPASPAIQQKSLDQESEQPQNFPRSAPATNQSGNSILAPAEEEQLDPKDSKVRDEANKNRLKLVELYYKERWLNDSEIEKASSPMYRYECGLGLESGPWRIKGGKLGLFYVYMPVYERERRLAIRHLYHNITKHYDVAFAVGYPSDKTLLPETACTEQAMYGDLILVNSMETMNDGKGFHAIMAMRKLLLSVWKGGYKYVVKVDDDAYIHFPHLYTWMTEKRAAEFASSKFVFFGISMSWYLKGPFVGWSIDLFLKVSEGMEAKYAGGHHEDWLMGFWTKLYGPDEIVKVVFKDNEYKHYESWENNM